MKNQMSLRTPRHWWEVRGFRAFALGFGCAFLLFLPFVIYDRGYFLFYGDFNVQQVPFYQMIHDAIRSGDWSWSWTTDLGANTVGSYSFYLLGSPFFWLTLPFPGELVPKLMAPLLMLKFACASWGGYIYLRRYVQNRDHAVLGGLLYAFSGFSIYNIFFNHFHEAIVIFPLLLAALDAYMEEDRRGVFAAAVFASCLMNYYFFAGQVVFCFLYWGVRTAMGDWKFHWKKFLLLAAESVLGVVMTGILLVPTVLAVLQNNRVNSPTVGWSALVYSAEQRYWHILSCFFFMPDIPARANFTPDSSSNWASLGAWLPLFSMTGVFAWLRVRKSHWSKKVLIFLLIAAFVPIFNNAFQLFNSAYYARWYYMLTLMFVLATVQAVEEEEADWKGAFRWTLGITAAIAVLIGLMPKSIDNDTGKITEIGLEKYPERFWTYVAVALLSLLLLYLLLPLRRRKPAEFAQRATAGVMAMALLSGYYFIGLGKTQSYSDHDFIIPHVINGGEGISLPDREGETENYRTDFYETMDNVPMFWKLPTIQAFHSIIPGSVMEFYPSVGVERAVGSRPEVTHLGIRGLLSVKYLFDYTDDGDEFLLDGTPKMTGFSYYNTQNGFDLYTNDNYIPMGFTYDRIMTREQFTGKAQNLRELMLLKAMMVENEDFDKVAKVITPLSDEEKTALDFSDEAYAADCAARNRETCTEFHRYGSGFTAKIWLEKANYVFFSVPYEDGWSARVDGTEAEIVKVNNGFMAVLTDAGEHDIEFRYETPGLSRGAALTVGGAGLFGLYLALCALSRKKKKDEAKEIPAEQNP